jgi:hypothetical protein
MTTADPLDGPFKPSAWLTSYSDDPGYAILPADPAGTPNRATLLRQEGMNR